VDGADGDVAGEVVVAIFVATVIGRRGALAGGFGDKLRDRLAIARRISQQESVSGRHNSTLAPKDTIRVLVHCWCPS
jgi:hypothetical protein